MVSRVLVRCANCSESLLLRITIAGGEQPFVFACPHCESEVHATLFAEPLKDFDLRSEDFELVDPGLESSTDLSVPVTTDLPVHTSLIGVPADQAPQTPFIHLAAAIGPDVLRDVMPGIERMRAARTDLFPHVRRAATQFARGNLPAVTEALRRAPGGKDLTFDEDDPVDMLGLLIAGLYAPFEDTDLRQAAATEWAKTVGTARAVDEVALVALLKELAAGPLPEHHARVVETAMNALASDDALYPPLLAEAMDGRVDMAGYRVMRDDFDTLKTRYQDIFELASRTLAFTSRVANIAHRSDVREHADGTSRTLHKALNKTTAYKREPWLADFPVAKTLYDAMKRHTRNDIGHRLVRYDFATGLLVYDDGKTENYLAFLGDYLQAVRLTHYLQDIFELLWHVRKRLLPSS